jgi:hypothetical protein
MEALEIENHQGNREKGWRFYFSRTPAASSTASHGVGVVLWVWVFLFVYF